MGTSSTNQTERKKGAKASRLKIKNILKLNTLLLSGSFLMIFPKLPISNHSETPILLITNVHLIE